MLADDNVLSINNIKTMSLQNWSPNYLSSIPYHLQLKEVIEKAMNEGRLSDGTVLLQPQLVGVKSLFQKNYAVKAYNLLVTEGKIFYQKGTGYLCAIKLGN
ncbi:hypothetical protein [Pedobacter cryotolerans]|uniref:GntR family transcriptional regulator n=1 Tax=Pedobacter cryotolerans TaxID=2571270 RepID=A0A4U1BV35_9SPHI|nr:hypothetical protein [Pedobacter cryotolerans]TKB96611.1 hypothetical protein FA045_17850 [Pedobacter cryotolerans]